MADLAHDASGPASSEPAGIAVRDAGGPTSSDKEKLRVFISYSRDDLKFADQLDDALNACDLAKPTRSFSCSRRVRRAPQSATGRWKKRHD